MHLVNARPALESRKTWSITEAVFIGVGGSVAFVLLAYFFSSLINPYGYAMTFGRFQTREATALVAQVGAGLVFVPVLLWVARRRGSEGFWASIGWNSTRLDITSTIVYAAILATAVSVALTARYGSAGSLRSPADVVLYVLSEVLVGSLMEETYFRGILFSALDNKLGALASILIVTLISSLVHLGHVFYVLPVMALLGFTRLRTESVASCFVLHASYNLFVGVYVLVAR